MPIANKNLRTCDKGHQYYKSSDCPVCPICANNEKPSEGFMRPLAAPARRALERAGITTLVQLSKFSEKEILELHGMGPSSIPKLRKELYHSGLSFKK